MRLDLESLAAELAAGRASTGELAHLETLMERTRAELASGGTPDSLIALDRETHGALWAAADNAQLERTLDWLYVHVMRLWNYALPRIEGIPALIRRPPRDRRGRPGAGRRPPRAADARARRGLPALVPAPPGAASRAPHLPDRDPATGA